MLCDDSPSSRQRFGQCEQRVKCAVQDVKEVRRQQKLSMLMMGRAVGVVHVLSSFRRFFMVDNL